MPRATARLRKAYPNGPPWYSPQNEDLVAVDLGKRKVGVAVFSVDRLLKTAFTVYYPTWGDRKWNARHMASEVALRIAAVTTQGDIVQEWPVVRDLFRVAEKDIKTLQAVGRILGSVERYKPREWKGNVPKEVHHARLRQVLSTDELLLIDGTHDAWDAVGIGLFANGRTGRGGTRP